MSTFELNVARSVWRTTVVVPTKIHFKIKAITDILTVNLTGLFSGTPWKLFSCMCCRNSSLFGHEILGGVVLPVPPETPLCACAHLR